MKANLKALGIRKNETGNYEARYPSLKASDIGDVGKMNIACVKDVKERKFNDETKIVLALDIPELEKSEKGRLRNYSLNETNTVSMLRSFGEDYDAWIGQIVEARIENTLFGGDVISGIRLYPQK